MARGVAGVGRVRQDPGKSGQQQAAKGKPGQRVTWPVRADIDPRGSDQDGEQCERCRGDPSRGSCQRPEHQYSDGAVDQGGICRVSAGKAEPVRAGIEIDCRARAGDPGFDEIDQQGQQQEGRRGGSGGTPRPLHGQGDRHECAHGSEIGTIAERCDGEHGIGQCRGAQAGNPIGHRAVERVHVPVSADP